MVIQVLPCTASDHPGTDGPILVYDFDGAPSVAYTECNGGGRIIESPDEVGDLMMIVNMIRAEELADILEVLCALAGRAGTSRQQLEELRVAKEMERGSFTGRIIWSGNRPSAAQPRT